MTLSSLDKLPNFLTSARLFITQPAGVLLTRRDVLAMGFFYRLPLLRFSCGVFRGSSGLIFACALVNTAENAFLWSLFTFSLAYSATS